VLDRGADVEFLEARLLAGAGVGVGVVVHGVRGGGGGVLGGAQAADGDLEVEVGEERAWEVRVPVAAFQDDAVEFGGGDGDGPVAFLLAAAREAGEEACVEERHPAGLGGDAPVEEGQEDAG